VAKGAQNRLAFGQSGPRVPNSAVTALFCQHAGCTRADSFQADGLTACTVVARRSGWDVSYDGPGHGWVQFCPEHARPERARKD
jgi:hypothetical protein